MLLDEEPRCMSDLVHELLIHREFNNESCMTLIMMIMMIMIRMIRMIRMTSLVDDI
jgi:hypothetical protein